jgi:hypothetical protein
MYLSIGTSIIVLNLTRKHECIWIRVVVADVLEWFIVIHANRIRYTFQLDVASVYAQDLWLFSKVGGAQNLAESTFIWLSDIYQTENTEMTDFLRDL